MKKQLSFKKTTISKCVALSLLMLTASQAHAFDISLCTGEFTKAMPDGTFVKMWGYGIDTDADCTTASVPGPQITIPVDDLNPTKLNITLRNTLSEAVSIIIPGLKGTAGNTPAFFAADSQGRVRVRSLATETETGASTLYSFDTKPGTHLYQSGTHPAVQVQMGLYGAEVQTTATGEAYPGVSYDNEIVMLYSEIDPAMHDAIAGTADGLTAATYGPTGTVTSTIGYKARYFLVNGESFTAGSTLPVGNTGDRVLIRFLNAGLESHVPVLQGQHMSMIAEYGHAYTFAREQYSVLLPAGVTKDAIFSPLSSGDFPLYDRRLRLTNSSQAGPGGLMSILSVADTAPTSPAAVASADTDTTPEDTAKLVDVLFNDTTGAPVDPASIEIAAQPTNGNAVVAATGGVTYTPNLDFNGTDSFSYTVRNTTGDISNVAAVTVTVTPVNDAPIGVDDEYNATVNTVLTGNVLNNDTDIELDALSTTAATSVGTYGTLALNADGSFNYTAGAGVGTDTFTYTLSDSVLTSTATVTINVVAAVNEAPVAVDDYATVTRNTGTLANSVRIIVVANDTDAEDVTVDPASIVISTNSLNGSVVADTAGGITYTPRAGFRGSDAFSYTVKDSAGLTSNIATVRIDVLK